MCNLKINILNSFPFLKNPSRLSDHKVLTENYSPNFKNGWSFSTHCAFICPLNQTAILVALVLWELFYSMHDPSSVINLAAGMSISAKTSLCCSRVNLKYQPACSMTAVWRLWPIHCCYIVIKFSLKNKAKQKNTLATMFSSSQFSHNSCSTT